ncbi:MAG TPA: type II secretion system F family protein, partial [Rhodanobacteraceae bacterium]|nr:type II secretion system F family protein [Rhodanobacteraceae bacterium]
MATASVSRKVQQRGAARAQISQTTMYDWVALDKRGQKMKGEMAGKNASLVKAELRRQGMNPQSVKPKPKPLFGSSGKRVTPRDVAIFSRQ